MLQVYVNKKQAPNFSFGIRHSQYEAPLIIEVRDWAAHILSFAHNWS